MERTNQTKRTAKADKKEHPEVTDEILVIGDPHYIQSRKKSIQVAEDSIFSFLAARYQKTSRKIKRCVITGDIFHKTPTVEERVMFAQFLQRLSQYCEEFVLLKGTDTHEFSKGFYNLEDVIILTEIKAVEDYEANGFVFGHYEVKGTRYINGTLTQSQKEAHADKTYVLGHIHSPSCSFKNVNYVGSMYKTAFDQINDKKRIALIQGNKIEWVEIASRPMYEIQVVGQAGKVKASGLKTLQESGDKEIDLKIKVMTDSSSLAATHRAINKIQEGFAIEYYQQEIKINGVKTDVPEDLDQDALLKKFCELKKAPYTLVVAEMQK